ncbi:MAG TPA: D-alanyl-D-alanine carboxypeptidase/D-alanyl-D-alanine-endopeptidase, partial [Longimicrobiales bacterium]|nr:D-alanyl-D-alanine carboxypeptidase/D-alanyl-D-alanine-endopeptidase [Longimicrobiales bacterium]
MRRPLILTVLTGLAVAGAATAGPADAPVDAPITDAAVQETSGPADLEQPVAAAPAASVSPAVATLRSEIDGLIQEPGWRDAAWSVMAVSLERGDTLYAHNPGAALAPASNMKLFTTAAALYYLGPDFRYGTFLMTDGVVANGVLDGDLVLYGTGDPTLADRFGSRRAVWQAFADTLLTLGITRISGDVVGDASYFEGGGTPEGWQTSYMNASYAAPSSALSYAENVATVQVAPGAQAGWRPEVTLVPGGEGIGVVNNATTVASGRTTIRIRRSAYDGPVVVSGQIARNASPVVRAVVVSDPERFAAAALRYELQERGITVDGGVRGVTSAAESPVTGRSVFAPGFREQPPLRVLAVHTSPPIIEILDIINHKSHNMMAEQTLRTVGRVVAGSGSVQGGARAVQAMLERELDQGGIDQLTIYDGSGLSVLNRASARSFIQLLDAMSDSPMWQAFWSTLPESGAPGGLRRMYRTPAEGNLRAKTGTINHVSALSGYVRAANGERIAFSIISNNVPSTWRAKRIEDG